MLMARPTTCQQQYLEPPKCSWTPILWNYNQLGHTQLAPIPNDPSLQLYATNLTGQSHHLRINQPSDAIQLLGIHITADGNYVKEPTILKQKQQNTPNSYYKRH